MTASQDSGEFSSQIRAEECLRFAQCSHLTPVIKAATADRRSKHKHFGSKVTNPSDFEAVRTLFELRPS